MMKSLLLSAFLGLALLPAACGGGSGPSDATDFCHQVESTTCTKVFQCVPAAERDQTFTDTFGDTVAACTAMMDADCATATTDCPKYNSSAAETCLSKIAAVSCTSTSSELPAECNTACGM
jgi:hypothetical protein